MATDPATPTALPAAVDREIADFNNNSSASFQSSHAGHKIVCGKCFPLTYLTCCITSAASVVNTASLSGTNLQLTHGLVHSFKHAKPHPPLLPRVDSATDDISFDHS